MLFGREQEPLQLFRVGIISSVDEKKCTARVLFEDRDNTVSHDLKIVVPQTMKNKYYWLPDIGESVLCCFLQNGIETGFILGSIYSEEDKPAFEDKSVKGIQFEDGTVIKYDTKSSTLTVDGKGAINIVAPSGVNVIGNIDVTGDVVAGGISLRNHVHPETNVEYTLEPK